MLRKQLSIKLNVKLRHDRAFSNQPYTFQSINLSINQFSKKSSLHSSKILENSSNYYNYHYQSSHEIIITYQDRLLR